jgi:hypothetical protein
MGRRAVITIGIVVVAACAAAPDFTEPATIDPATCQPALELLPGLAAGDACGVQAAMKLATGADAPAATTARIKLRRLRPATRCCSTSVDIGSSGTLRSQRLSARWRSGAGTTAFDNGPVVTSSRALFPRRRLVMAHAPMAYAHRHVDMASRLKADCKWALADSRLDRLTKSDAGRSVGVG